MVVVGFVQKAEKGKRGKWMIRFQARASGRSKGRNGLFWPVAASVKSPTQRIPDVRIDIEGAKSVNGASAPIQLVLMSEDAGKLAQRILESLGKVPENRVCKHCGCSGVLGQVCLSCEPQDGLGPMFFTQGGENA